MLNNLSPQQFGAQQPSTNTNQTSANGQAEGSDKSTTTVISVKGDAPSLSTRSS